MSKFCNCKHRVPSIQFTELDEPYTICKACNKEIVIPPWEKLLSVKLMTIKNIKGLS